MGWEENRQFYEEQQSPEEENPVRLGRIRMVVQPFWSRKTKPGFTGRRVWPLVAVLYFALVLSINSFTDNALGFLTGIPGLLVSAAVICAVVYLTRRRRQANAAMAQEIMDACEKTAPQE